MRNSENNSLINQLRQVIKDGIDYLQSSLQLLQARAAEFALSGILFGFLLLSGFLLGVAAFVFYNIALGCWLAKILGSVPLSITVLGSGYALLAVICITIALRWLKTLKS